MPARYGYSLTKSSLTGQETTTTGDEFEYKELPEKIRVNLSTEIFKNQKKVEESFCVIDLPESKIFDTKESSLKFRGVINGDIKVYLNGEEIKSDNGSFQKVETLNPGLNIFTFQIIKGTGQLSHEIFKVTKKP